MLNLTEIIQKRRTVRFFKQEPVPENILLKIADCALLAPSAANKQPLRYVVVSERQTVRKVLAQTRWAGYITPKRTPEPGVNGPTAFIAVCCAAPERMNDPMVFADAGAAIENMLLCAEAEGFGGCWLGAFDHAETEKILEIPEGTVLFLVALGKPAEEPVCQRISAGDDIRYFLDEKDVLHVPKHSAESAVRFS